MTKVKRNPLDTPEIVENEPVVAGSETMDSLTENEEFPRPDEEAIAAITKGNQNDGINAAPKTSSKKDEEKFDASIHRTDDTGKPVLTKTGKFRKKTGYAKFVNPEAKKETPAGTQEISSAAAATLTSGIIERLSVMLVSDDFIYSEIERAQNVIAWTNCYDYYGGVNLTPPMALACDHMAIILARANKPTFHSKLALFTAWIKNKFKRKNKNGSLPGSGNDGKRQDDVGAQKGA